MADIALNSKKRQASYAARNRRKAKALRRPDARAVADAYMTAVEGGGLEQIMRIYISKLSPEADASAGSRDVLEMVRNLARIILFEKGFDDEQVRDKMKSMLTD